MPKFNSLRAVISFCLLFGLALCTTVALAQSTVDGAIGGTVTDPTGAVVAGATVTAFHAATNYTSTVTSDPVGVFRFTHLQPGTYTVTVKSGSFSEYKAADVIVEVGRVTNLDVKLAIGGQKEAVEVTGEAPVIETVRADVSNNVNTVAMNDLPVNLRRWSSFALASPGAVADGTFGLVAFRGISGLLNNNTVDGGDNNNAYFSEERGRTRATSTIGQGAIREFQVNTSNFSAEYGRAAGAVVNAVTKSGTNGLHGSGFLFATDSAMWAKNPFSTQTILVNGVATQTVIKPPDRRWQFGGNIGGPIKKDRVFFFLNYDQQKENAPGVATPTPSFFNAITVAAPANCRSTTTPGQVLWCRGIIFPSGSAALAPPATPGVTQAQSDAAMAFLAGLTGPVSRNKDQWALFPKIDFRINDRNTLSGDWNHMRWNSIHGIQTASVVARGVASWGDDFVNVDTVNARLVSLISDRVTNEFRTSIGREDQFENSNPPGPGEPATGPGGRPPAATVNRTGSGSFVIGKPNFLERAHLPLETRLQFTDIMTWVISSHLLKWGFDVNRSHDTIGNLFQEGGEYSFTNIEDFISDYTSSAGLCTIVPASGPRALGPCYNTFSQGVGPTTYKFSTIDYSMFLQDEWHVARRVTASLGLRWEYEKMPKAIFPNTKLPQTAVSVHDLGDFGPRLGLAWDITGDGKTVLRGGYGIYYGRIINGYIGNVLAVTGSPQSQLSTGSLKPCIAGTAGCVAPTYPNVLTGATASSSPPSVAVWGLNVNSPRIHEGDIVLEREVARNTVVSVSYLVTAAHRLPFVVDRNISPSTVNITYKVIGGPDTGATYTFPFYTSRINSSFSNINNLEYIGKSRYDGVVFQVNRRMTNGLQLQASYTHARSTDTNQHTGTGNTSNDALDPYNLNVERGTSGFDIRHKFGFGAVWQPQVSNAGPVAKTLINGFSFAPIISVGSGGPLQLFTSGSAPTLCVPVAGVCPASGATTYRGVISAVIGSGISRLPNVPRNSMSSPTIAFANLRISRRFRITEGKRMEFLAEVFNITNHFNPTSFNQTVYTVGCGTGVTPAPLVCSTGGSPTLTYNAFDPIKNTGLGAVQNGNNGDRIGLSTRQFQIGARFEF